MSMRMACTAAPSAPFLSPRPTHRAAAMAPASVTRTSSMARFRSGALRGGRGGSLTVTPGSPGMPSVCCSVMAGAFRRELRSERRAGLARPRLVGRSHGEPGSGAFEPLRADGSQPLALLPEFQRFLQGEPPALKPPDHIGELIAR